MMSDVEKVVGIHGWLPPLKEGEPTPEIISDLKRLLALAETGQLVGLAYATIVDDGTPRSLSGTGWQIRPGLLIVEQLYSTAAHLLRRLENTIDSNVDGDGARQGR